MSWLSVQTTQLWQQSKAVCLDFAVLIVDIDAYKNPSINYQKRQFYLSLNSLIQRRSRSSTQPEKPLLLKFLPDPEYKISYGNQKKCMKIFFTNDIKIEEYELKFYLNIILQLMKLIKLKKRRRNQKLHETLTFQSSYNCCNYLRIK